MVNLYYVKGFVFLVVGGFYFGFGKGWLMVVMVVVLMVFEDFVGFLDEERGRVVGE